MRKILLFILLGILLARGSLAYVDSQNLTVKILPGGIIVYSPAEMLYFHRMIPINLTMSTNAQYFSFSDNGSPFRTFCRDCNEYGNYKLKRKPFDDGFHEIIIKATFEAGSVYNYTNFTVDTLPPKITKTWPEGGFATSWFSVEFQEANPKELALNYGNDPIGWQGMNIDLNSCRESKKGRKKCDVFANLSDYDGGEIKYWFELKDISENYTESNPKKLEADFSKPMISYFNYSISRKRVSFTFNITERNFDKISYIDWGDRGQKPILICSRLKENMCEKIEIFEYGTHNLTIEVKDNAGNIAKIPEVIFSV